MVRIIRYLVSVETWSRGRLSCESLNQGTRITNAEVWKLEGIGSGSKV